MIRFSLFFLFCAGFLPLVGQSVQGTVTSVDGDTLPGVSVTFENRYTAGTTTDGSGYYALDVASGTYRLRYSAVGYAPQTILLSLQGDDVRRLDVQLLPAITQLEGLTVLGIRAEQSDPVAQTNLNRQSIERLFVGQDAQFLLSQAAPSIITHTESGAGFSNYGGMRMRGIDQTRINITLNGVPLNDMLDQGVFFSNMPDFANSVQSLQVLRGVGTASNGTASFAGSINFETLSLQEESGVELQLGGGSFQTLRSSVQFQSGMLDKRFAFSGRMTNFSTEGYRNHSGSDAWSMFLTGGYFGDKDLVKFTLLNGRTASQMAYFPVPLPLIEQDARTNLNYEQDRDNFGQFLTQLEYTRSLSHDWTLTISPYMGGAGGDFPYGFDSVFDISGPLAGQINYPLTNRHYGLFAHSTYEKRGFRMQGGMHGYRFDRNNWETFLPDNVTRIYNDSAAKVEMSAFVKAQYSTGRIRLFADIQARSTTMTFFPDFTVIGADATIPEYQYNFINPTIGITADIHPHWQAYASFGRTSREPTKFDLFGGSTRLDSLNLLALQDPNTVLPESVNDVEAGVRIRKRKLTAQANLFWMEFRNEIAPIGERLLFVQLRTNVPSSFRRGVEVEAAWQMSRSLSLQGFLTLMDARIRTYDPKNDDSDEVFSNVRPVLTPSVLAQATARYDHKKVSLMLTGRYTGDMYIEPTNQQDLVIPASLVMDVQLRWNFLQQHELVLMVNNLLDAQYYTYGEVGFHSGNTVPALFVQPPRHVQVMARLVF